MVFNVKGKQIFSSSLSILIGFVFIISAISKLPTLETFGWTIVETTFINWTMAEWLARILIGFEFVLGFLFLFHIHLKRITIPIAYFTLFVFTSYLLLVINQYGSNGNCGCFGEWIPMTPLQSVIKNILLIIMMFLLQKLNCFELQFKHMKYVIPSILVLLMLIPFFYHPPESIYIIEKEKFIQKPIPLSLLYQSKNNKAPLVELRKGKHIIAFMSLSCRFCRKAAKRLQIMKHKHPELPFYFVLNGNPEMLSEFYEETGCKSIPHSMFNGAEQFSRLNDGYSLPTIKWVKDTTVIKESNYLNIDEHDIIKWISK